MTFNLWSQWNQIAKTYKKQKHIKEPQIIRERKDYLLSVFETDASNWGGCMLLKVKFKKEFNWKNHNWISSFLEIKELSQLRIDRGKKSLWVHKYFKLLCFKTIFKNWKMAQYLQPICLFSKELMWCTFN